MLSSEQQTLNHAAHMEGLGATSELLVPSNTGMEVTEEKGDEAQGLRKAAWQVGCSSMGVFI